MTGNYWDYPTRSDNVPSNDLVNPDPGNNADFYDGSFTIGGEYWMTEAGEFENSASPYETFDQGGSVWEWNEAVIGSSRGVRSGSFGHGYSDTLLASYRVHHDPTIDLSTYGFRAASVPEPGSIRLMLCDALAGLCLRKRRK